ncbi:MAG TPA: MFS transporter [Polyangia bacterium]|nr:MFS transporter [Polyangia bacterium]
MSTETTAAEAAAAPPPAAAPAAPPALAFTPYQKTVVAILAFLNFTIILDFMIISPLGALLLRDLHIPTKKFGLVVSAYAFSAAISGILSAGYADKFDRKKLLMFFYTGFIAGTLLCGLAPTYELLLAARIVTGVFGGVIGSIAMAIIADLFPLAMRGRVMGVTQTAFAASQVLGLPLGWTLANHFGWHAPFLMIAGLGAVAGVFIMLRLKPVNEHLKRPREGSAFAHLYRTLFEPRYIVAFVTTIFLATGGFMLMPFGSTFTINNIGISPGSLQTIYFLTGLCTLVTGPLIGRFADRSGKYFVFGLGTILTVIMAYVYTHLGRTPLGWVVVVNALLFMGVTARMISATALMSAVPDPSHRGSFMSINTAVSQGAGGVGAFVAGLIVVQQPAGTLLHYDTLGYVVIASMLLVVVMLKAIDRMVAAQRA